MPNLLATGASALLAFQRALATSSHNVANANTAGYTRQRVQFGPRYGEHYGFGYVGGGAQLIGVERLADRFLGDRLLDSASTVGKLKPLAQFTARLDATFSGASTGLGAPLDDYFAAIEGVSSSPASGAARQEMIARGNALASRFASLADNVQSQQVELQARIDQGVADVNDDASQLARLNRQIVEQQAAFGTSPNDLLDERDRILGRLATRIGITTTMQDDGAINAFTTGGQALVIGTSVTRLSTVVDPYDPSRKTIALDSPAGAVPLPEARTGGEIGGMLQYRREVLDPAVNNLGRLAVSLAHAVNAQHREGIDATGALGGDFFVVPQPAVAQARGNTGTGTLAATIVDPAQLSGQDYEFRFDGAAWGAFDRATGAAVPMTGTGTSGDPFLVGGMSIVAGGAPAAGDRMLVQPLARAALELDVAITDPNRVAAADALRGSAALGNLGNARIGRVDVTDAADPNLQVPVTIAFVTPGTYTVNGNGPFPYTSGTPIVANGWQVPIEGTPSAGDTFSVGARGANSGDNGNARELAALARAALVGGTQTMSQGSGALVGSIGASARSAATTLQAEEAVGAQLDSQRDATAGVNLDEEAADMVRFQQAYDAAAQVISIADQMFQSLLGAVRR